LGKSNKDLLDEVFPVKDFRKSFQTACRIAGTKTGGIDGIVTHRLRHSTATRLVKGKMPIRMVGRILGHQQPQTTYRYLSDNDETLYQACEILESYQHQITSNSQNESDFVTWSAKRKTPIGEISVSLFVKKK
jgi:integrase